MSIVLPSHVRPSFATGYARNASESATPELWDGAIMFAAPALGNTGSTIHDNSGHGRDGSFFNADPDWIQSPDGAGLDFDGSSGQRVVWTTGNEWFPRLYTDNVTVHCLIRLEAPTATKVHWGYGRSDGFGGADFELNSNATDHQIMWFNAATQVAITSAITTGKWHSITATLGGNTLYAYVDGSLIDTVALASNLGAQDTNEFSLGGPKNITRNSDSAIATCMIWDRTLTPNQIGLLNRDPLAPFRRRIHIPLATEAAAPVGTGVKNPFMGPFSLPLQGSI